jgi:gamma-glutamyl-gamma-aminobutyraldehyde dehydrogenase
MTDLLTHAEYQAIAQDLNLPCNAYIDGKFQSSKSKKTFESINPATGKIIAKIAACDATDVLSDRDQADLVE